MHSCGQRTALQMDAPAELVAWSELRLQQLDMCVERLLRVYERC